MRDEAGRTWTPFGTLEPGDETTFARNNQPMALNNTGDTIELVNPQGTTTHTVTYDNTTEGTTITPE